MRTLIVALIIMVAIIVIGFLQVRHASENYVTRHLAEIQKVMGE